MKNYKKFIVLIFAIYLGLVVIFHRELQGTPVYTQLLSINSRANLNNAALDNGNMLRVRANGGAIPLRILASKVNVKVLPKIAEQKPEYFDPDDPYGFKKPFHRECRQKNKHFTVPNIHQLSDAYLYSAFYDDRRETHQIRIMSLVRRQLQPNLTCVFPENGGRTRVVYYQMCENHNRAYGGWYASCPVPKNLTSFPCQIKVVRRIGEKEFSTTMPVQASNSLSREPVKQFGICVPPLFKYINPRLLVRFIEICLLLGANHLTFYTMASVQREVLMILRHYEVGGVVTWNKWKLPIPPSNVWYNGQLITINDCLYRNMYNFEYLAFHDIDELLVPHAYANWTAMASGLARERNNTPIAGYMFNSGFFRVESRTQNKHDFFTSETKRTRTISAVRTKVLVRPRDIFELGIHHISRPIEDFLRPFRVDERKVLLHHYRNCTMQFDPRMKCKIAIDDRSLLKHTGDKLEKRFRESWFNIFNATISET